MKEYKIVIVDDEVLFRKGLNLILSETENFNILFEAENGQDLLIKLQKNNPLPDIILLDLQMPKMDGVETLKALQKQYPEIKVAILTSHYNSTLISKMIELGASSFMAKNTGPEEFEKTIINVVNQGFDYNEFTLKILQESRKKKNIPIEELTRREKEILQLICEQYTNKEIAGKLYISKRTVEGHRNKMIEKTESKNTVGLIIYAIENGIYSLNMINALLAKQ